MYEATFCGHTSEMSGVRLQRNIVRKISFERRFITHGELNGEFVTLPAMGWRTASKFYRKPVSK